MPPPGDARSVGRADDVDLLALLWRTWHRAGSSLTSSQWASPSGLGDWTVRDLYAHVAKGVTTTATLPVTREPPVLADAAAYFLALRPLGAQGAHHVAASAKEWATRPTLVEDFDTLATSTLARFRTATTVTTIAGPMRILDYALTRVLEATVHLLDLTAAVPGIATVPEPALHRTVDVLADLTPPADFIALATGRSTPALFPVLT